MYQVSPSNWMLMFMIMIFIMMNLCEYTNILENKEKKIMKTKKI